MKNLAIAVLLTSLLAGTAYAQVNEGAEQVRHEPALRHDAGDDFRLSLASGLPARWPHAGDRKGRPPRSGDPGRQEDRRWRHARRSITRARTACWACSSRPITPPTIWSISPMSSRVNMAAAWRWAAAAQSGAHRRRPAGMPAAELRGAVAPIAQGHGRPARRADRFRARRQFPVPDRGRPPAHDAGAGSQPAGRQDFAPDAGRQARARQSQFRQDRRDHRSPDRSARRYRSGQDRAGGEHLYLHHART